MTVFHVYLARVSDGADNRIGGLLSGAELSALSSVPASVDHFLAKFCERNEFREPILRKNETRTQL